MPLGVVYITGEILLEKTIFFHSFVSSYALEIDSGVYLGPYIFHSSQCWERTSAIFMDTPFPL